MTDLYEKTVVGMNAWVVHRDATIFREDVDQFRPERWLDRKSGDMGEPPPVAVSNTFKS